ncbi:PEP-CTERM sorting domain-containing protein [Haloferula sargassicola]|uniref:Ice-binding protein C-terminal domain-containing protein n=1 Tax=Haloferula sargassicola TaxID=490096 RepID=A0ABP9UQD6_9BACT
MKSRSLLPRAAAAAILAPLAVDAAVLYEQDFDLDDTANWTVNTPGLSDVTVDFHYDYSAIGVPAAPGSATTTGLKMTANNSGGVFSGFSVSPTGQSFSGDYLIRFSLWSNYVGPLGPGGSGSTQLSIAGFGTAGTSAQWAGAAAGVDSVFFAATLDGGSASDFRAYSTASPTSYPSGNAVYAGPSTNGSDPYYSVFGSTSAPAAQTLLFPGQTGVTDAGETAFAWRAVEILVEGGFATWSIDGLDMATLDLSTVTLGGSNILFGHSDTNAGASADPNDVLLNVTLIDNVRVTDLVPEPSTALLALAGLAVLSRRRRA